jgi:hypothetical protein
MIILLTLAAIVAGAPILVALLVSIASLREDAEHSLGGRAPGWLTRAARRLLHADMAAGSRRVDVPRLPRQRAPDHHEGPPEPDQSTSDNDDATWPLTR